MNIMTATTSTGWQHEWVKRVRW